MRSESRQGWSSDGVPSHGPVGYASLFFFLLFRSAAGDEDLGDGFLCICLAELFGAGASVVAAVL